jgi:uncharacterized protein DUF4342
MSISIEKVDLLMERARIGYKEAYELLQQHDGSVIEALIYLENNQKTKASSGQYHTHYNNGPNTMDNIQSFINETHQKRFTVSNDERRVLDLPLTVAGVAGVIALPIAIPLLGLGLITGHKINILTKDNEVCETVVNTEKENTTKVEPTVSNE